MHGDNLLLIACQHHRLRFICHHRYYQPRHSFLDERLPPDQNARLVNFSSIRGADRGYQGGLEWFTCIGGYRKAFFRRDGKVKVSDDLFVPKKVTRSPPYSTHSKFMEPYQTVFPNAYKAPSSSHKPFNVSIHSAASAYYPGGCTPSKRWTVDLNSKQMEEGRKRLLDHGSCEATEPGYQVRTYNGQVRPHFVLRISIFG